VSDEGRRASCAIPDQQDDLGEGPLLVHYRDGVIGADVYISGFLQRPSRIFPQPQVRGAPRDTGIAWRPSMTPSP
jgi:hypothetical protein